MSDQTLAPVHLRLQIDASRDAVSWLELKLGEKGNDVMVRTPFVSSARVHKRWAALEGQADRFDWFYRVTFGDRRM